MFENEHREWGLCPQWLRDDNPDPDRLRIERKGEGEPSAPGDTLAIQRTAIPDCIVG